jgi:predicted metal-binding membrane protein
VGGLGGTTTLHRGIEAALRRDRLIVALSLAGVVALAWLYLWRAAASMHSGTGGGMAMTMPAMTFVMWIVMMAGMMLPSAAPTVLL